MLRDRIPKDIRDFNRKRILKSSALCVFIGIIEAAAVILFGGSLAERLNEVSMILLYLILFTIPFFASGLIKQLCDRSWEGVILAVHKKTTVGNTSILSRGGAYKMYVIEATMRMEDGKTDIKMVYAGPADQSQPWLYKEGTTVRHVAGCKHLQIINEDEENKTTVCVVCGRDEEKEERTICKRCGHTLIK